MRNLVLRMVLCLALLVTLASRSAPIKQQKNVVPGPIPAQIINAKAIFIANAPGDNFPETDGGPNRPYNQVYGAIKAWAHYDLVSSPTEADLVFEVSFTNKLAGTGGLNTTACSAETNPQLSITILDPKTGIPLWWLAEDMLVKQRFLHPTGKLTDAFDDSVSRLIDDLKKLATSSTAS